MDEKKALAWLKKVRKEWPGRDADLPTRETWVGIASTAMRSIFPPRHPLMGRWAQHDLNFTMQGLNTINLIAVIDAAIAVVADGHMSTLLDGVRAETVTEVLDQAEYLIKYPVASVVMAGGALETHLRHHFNRNGLTMKGDPGISKYVDALEQAANNGLDVGFSGPDLGQCKTWGRRRNEAAHDPGAFKMHENELRLMIEGIRQLIGRTP